MAHRDEKSRCINIKIVYYGPGCSGKTTTLQYIHRSLPAHQTGDLLSHSTETERMVFFTCEHSQWSHLNGYTLRFHLYTLAGSVWPGQNKVDILRGADGIVFVTQAQPRLTDENALHLREVIDYFVQQQKSLLDIPFFLQHNKRDISGAIPIAVLEESINLGRWPATETVATKGIGIMSVFDSLCAAIVQHLSSQTPRIPHTYQQQWKDIIEKTRTYPIYRLYY